MPVDKLRTVVRVQPQKAEPQHPFDLIQRLLHRHLTPSQQGSRLGPAAVNVGEVQKWANSPSPEFPECETRSISVKPGAFTSQLSVFTGMWCFNKAPGWVRP